MKNEMIKAQVLLLLLVIFCGSTSYAQKQTSNSLLWEISGNGLQQPSYLFGTIHMICKEDFILSETAKQKFNSSKQVYLELDMDDPQLQMTMMQQLQLPSNESLKNKFDESDFKALDSFLMKELNMNLAVFDQFKPMMVMSLLAQRVLSCAEMESYEMNFVKMAAEQNAIKEKLKQLILDMNREKAVTLSLSLLENESITIHDLYEKVLKSALYSIDCQELDKECIWKEHVTTAIVRTIIEVSYPYLLKEKKNVVSNGKKVIVVCPSEEYHEIGARMVHDYFSLNGFESTMIGANTPLSVILDAVEFVKPDFVAVKPAPFV